METENLKKVIDYAAKVLPFAVQDRPTSLGTDIAISRLKNAAGLELTDKEAQLLENHGEY